MKPLPKPRKEPRQVRSKHMVETILESAARVLADLGYAGTTTNIVAERAGVSVGSVYQYFPNKDSLIAALHMRHTVQMYQVIDSVLSSPGRKNLRDHIAAIVRAMLAAHLVEPELHRVLEQEFPFFDVPPEENPTDQSIARRVRDLLEQWRDSVAPLDLELATWVVLRITETMVHAAVITPPRHFSTSAIEGAIVDAIMGYLTEPSSRP